MIQNKKEKRGRLTFIAVIAPFMLLTFLFFINFISAVSLNNDNLPKVDNEPIVQSSITINESNFEHNLLLNLQGTGTDYFHLNSTQYNNLGYCSLTNNTYKKYSDFNYVSIQGNELVMPKAGTYYFYIDKDVLITDFFFSNGVINKTYAQAKSGGWISVCYGTIDIGFGEMGYSEVSDIGGLLKYNSSLCQSLINNISLILPNKNPTYNNVTATNFCNSTTCKPLNGWINDTTYVSRIFGNNTYQKYSDYQLISVSNAVLNMPKAGWNYFYLDEDILASDVNMSNGTRTSTFLSDTYDWILQCYTLADAGGYFYYLPISSTAILYEQTNFFGNDSLCYTNRANITLIFPSTSSGGDSLWTDVSGVASYDGGINATKDTMMIYEGTNCIFIGDKSLYDGTC